MHGVRQVASLLLFKFRSLQYSFGAWKGSGVSLLVYFLERATVLVLTSDKEEKHFILPTTLNFVRRGKLRHYTLQNPPEVF